MRSFSVLLALAGMCHWELHLLTSASANALTVHEQFRRDVHDLEARQAQASLGDCTDICTPVIRNRHACANGPTTSESCADMCSVGNGW
jgi:hypothetical protein